jgi:hypothetical protein
LSRHTTFMLDGIADLKCKFVKISRQRKLLLFTEAEFSTKFLCSLC